MRQESYAAVEAALFRGHDRVTLILQNASDEDRTWKIGSELKLGLPGATWSGWRRLSL